MIADADAVGEDTGDAASVGEGEADAVSVGDGEGDSCANTCETAQRKLKKTTHLSFVIPSGVEESLTISEILRDVSTSLDMTRS